MQEIMWFILSHLAEFLIIALCLWVAAWIYFAYQYDKNSR